MNTCITCNHDDLHDAAGIGVCRFKDCGCDGPVTVENKIQHDEYVSSLRSARTRQWHFLVSACKILTREHIEAVRNVDAGTLALALEEAAK